MKLCFFNLTENAILFKYDCCRNDSELIVPPEASVAIPSGKQKFAISSVRGSAPEKVPLDYEEEQQYVVNLSKSSSSSRCLLAMPEDCPWRIYRDQTCKERTDILVLPKRPLESFLSDLPDTTPLYSLCLPGKSRSRSLPFE
ncbi:hypothetical protein H4582DRAFT_605995 [Lactarius indigo]|nr:hypothetical protein H4582DRAFT_605995 [Lactarius indigo]